jgi:PAS domain S-box-containing protein
MSRDNDLSLCGFLFNDHPAAMLIIDASTGKIIDANNAAVQFYGWSKEELLQMKIHDINTLTQDEVSASMKKARENLQVQFEFKHRCANGSIKDVEVWSGSIHLNGKNYLHSIIHDITARKMSESALRESEDKFRCIVESSPIAKYFYHLDKDNNLILTGANPSADRIIGISHKSLIGKKIEEAFPALAETDIPDMYRKIAKGELITQHFEIPYNDGRFQGEYDVTTFKTGPNSIAVDFTEISVRKKMERALIEAKERAEENEEQLRAIFNSSKDAIVISKKGIVELVNKSYLEMFGYSQPEEIIGKSILLNISPGEIDKIKDFINRRYSGLDAPYYYESAGLRKNGTEFPFEVNVGMYELNGEKYSVGIVRDITERKRSEAALKNSEEKFAKAFLASPDILFLTSLEDGIIVETNERIEKILGYTRNEIIGKSPIDLNIWEDISLRDEYVEAVKKEGSIHDKDVNFITKRGTLINALLSAELIELHGEKFILGTIRDITERKRMEEELLRTQKLESLASLAGGIAHDFNNLLGGIYGYIELAEEIAADNQLKEYLEKSISTIDRARDLSRQLITFAKGGAPAQSIGHLFPHIADTVKFALSGSNISYEFDIENGLWLSNYDKNQISQVIDNIVINAKQAMPDGGRLIISARNIELSDREHSILESGKFIKISIRDYGNGMTKELMQRIFDPFFTTKPSGHGLGLATCYSIIRKHGGAIDVESKINEGSTFHIFLPATTGIPAETLEPSDLTFRGNGTFVVMDDEKVIRDAISNMIKSLGYNVKVFSDGYSVIDFFKKEAEEGRHITGAILDLTVPGSMGGKDAVLLLKEISPGTFFFATSGNSDNLVISRPQDYNFTASISKPFRKSELVQLLSKHIKI